MEAVEAVTPSLIAHHAEDEYIAPQRRKRRDISVGQGRNAPDINSDTPSTSTQAAPSTSVPRSGANTSGRPSKPSKGKLRRALLAEAHIASDTDDAERLLKAETTEAGVSTNPSKARTPHSTARPTRSLRAQHAPTPAASVKTEPIDSTREVVDLCDSDVEQDKKVAEPVATAKSTYLPYRRTEEEIDLEMQQIGLEKKEVALKVELLRLRAERNGR